MIDLFQKEHGALFFETMVAIFMATAIA